MNTIDIFKKIYWDNVKIIDKINHIVEAARIHDIGGVWPLVSNLSAVLSKNLTEILQLQTEITCELIDQEYMSVILQSLLEAQTQNDYILMADLYEGQLLSYIYRIQEMIFSISDQPLYQECWWDNNLDAIQQIDHKLYEQLMELHTKKDFEEVYQLEPSSCGAYTMAIKDRKGRYYLHSNVDPRKEAREFANRHYQIDKERYVILGMGLGYHLQELKKLYEDIEMVVVEPDLMSLHQACCCNDLAELFQQVRIVYGENIWKEMQEELAEETELIIYPPALRHIDDETLRRRFENVMNRQNGSYRHKEIFFQNHRSNLRNCTGYVDAIRDGIAGRHVVIVAGGPSLDRNIIQIAEKHHNICVMSVGTVFDKLLRMNIVPDYVVASDVNAYPQFESHLQSDVPAILLTTADRRIARNYQGKRYLVCQKGYSLAVDYANNKQIQLYDCGGSVTTLALDIAIRMKAASVAFLGLDLAYEGDKFHASGTRYEKAGSIGDYIVTGIYGEQLRTSYNFIQYKEWIENRLLEQDVVMKIYDASEGGARIEHTEIITLEDYLNRVVAEQ